MKKTSIPEEDFLPARAPQEKEAPAAAQRIITIKRAKIKDGLFLEAEYSEELPGHGVRATKIACSVPVHDDLKEAFRKLHTHLAFLCDEISVADDLDLECLDFPEFGVRSFTMGGSDECEGVVISGYKEGRYWKVNLNTPFTKYGESDYPFISELSAHIEVCIYEVNRYLFEGKRAPDQQLELDFGHGDQEDPKQALRDIHAAAEAEAE